MSTIPERMVRKLSDKDGDIDEDHLYVLFAKCKVWSKQARLYPWQWREPNHYPLDEAQKLNHTLKHILQQRREDMRGMDDRTKPSPDIDCTHCYLIWDDERPTCFNLEQSNEQNLSDCPGDCPKRKARGDDNETMQTLPDDDRQQSK